MFGSGISAALGCKFLFLQPDLGRHTLVGVLVGQVAHAVVERVKTGQRNKLELIAHSIEFTLTLGNGRVVQVFLPVKRRRAIIGKRLLCSVAII